MKKVIVISGPTASGKSKLALTLAKLIDAEIINADAFQVYKQLIIGVEKPSKSDLDSIKHHLINFIDVDEPWSVAHFLKEAHSIIDNATKNIIVIGGSVLYIDALIKNYKLNDQKRTLKYDDLSCQELVSKISLSHPNLINDSNVNNHNRLTRMYQNIINNNINQVNQQVYQFFHIFVHGERSKIYEKINLRTEIMINNGLINEVQDLASQYDFNKYNAFKAIGYLDIFNNDFKHDQILIEKIKQKTRNYAKKQLTWCNNKFEFEFEYQNKIQIPLLEILIKNFLDGIEKPKSLYIHIPFCRNICTYCDFKRDIYQKNDASNYIANLVKQLKGIKHSLETIYIGGGTPNCLDNFDLKLILEQLNNNCTSSTEFTIELNPEFVNLEQINLLKQYNVNRISLGVQSLNDSILKKIGRIHNKAVIISAIELLNKHFDNISCDFIYNLPQMSENDIDDIVNFINKYQIKHLSFYALEIKDNALLNKMKYQIDIDEEANQMESLQAKLNLKTKLRRYEISNWSIGEKFFSKHNLGYWKMDQWYGIGNGATGFYQNCYLTADGQNFDYHYSIRRINQREYYQDIIIMGLRLIEGLDMNNIIQKNAFEYFKIELEEFLVKENNFLKIEKIDLLNEVLLKII